MLKYVVSKPVSKCVPRCVSNPSKWNALDQQRLTMEVGAHLYDAHITTGQRYRGGEKVCICVLTPSAILAIHVRIVRLLLMKRCLRYCLLVQSLFHLLFVFGCCKRTGCGRLSGGFPPGAFANKAWFATLS